MSDAQVPGGDETDISRSRYALPLAGVWLIVLLGPLGDVLARSTAILATALGIGLLVVFSLLYLTVVAIARDRSQLLQARQLTVLMVLVGLCILPLSGSSGLTTFIFVGVAIQLVLTWRAAIAATVALVALDIGLSHVLGWTEGGSFAFSIVAASMVMFGVVRMAERNRALLEAQHERSSYAVLAERERFARDLHDILGHSLTVITVKSELAGKLLERDPARARAEIDDIERLARGALADVRSTVGNYRTLSLTAELAAARTALHAAGIESDLPTAVDAVPGPLREVFAHVVREGVTNVVRHSGADRCRVNLAATGVEVIDDGTSRPGDAVVPGHGLDGLRHRAQAVGCVLEAGPGESGGFRLAAVTSGAQ